MHDFPPRAGWGRLSCLKSIMILSKEQVDPVDPVCLVWVHMCHPSLGHWRRTVPRRVTAAHGAGVMGTGCQRFFLDCQGSSCCPELLGEKGLSTMWACSALPAWG